MSDLFVQSKNTMPRIDKIWAWVSVDPRDGNEGICAARLDQTFMPLIAADPARLASIRALAEGVAKLSGMKLKLVEFSVRREVEEIVP